MSAAKIGVVLVNWNGAQHTIPCIESLRAGDLKPDTIVVVDNASRDDSVRRIADRFPDVLLVRNEENLGFTGANNVGIERLLAAGCDYVWILNNDTTVDAQCLSALTQHLETHLEVSACSGKILYAEPPDMIWYAGATYNPWTVRPAHRGQGALDTGEYEDTAAVPFISGCCMFVRREALEQLGLFDDVFFAYCEDSDWCLRASEAGRRMEYVPAAVLRHEVSATVARVKATGTAGTTSPFSIYITNRNRLFVIRKHAAGSIRMVTALVAHAAWIAYYAAALTLLGRFDKLKALGLSVRDGILQTLDGPSGVGRKPRYLK